MCIIFNRLSDQFFYMAKIVLISGGTEGIGSGIVFALLRDGFFVSTFSRNANKCNNLETELIKEFDQSKFLVLQADVTREADLRKVIDLTFAKFKNIDILINNAGFGYFSSCDEVDIPKFQEMVQTNLVGTVLLSKLVVPHMKKNRNGLIINMVSISGKIAYANGEFYAATKFGVMGYSTGLRNELKEFGIKVSTVCPGMIRSNFFTASELERRKKLNNNQLPVMLQINDVTPIITLICKQSEHCDIQDIVMMPF